MASLRELSKRMKNASQAVRSNADKLVMEVAATVLENVVSDTPVDTGRARSNWIVKLGSSATETRPPFVPGEKGSTGDDNIIAALAMGEPTLEAYRSGQAIHITNNLDYIGELNDGSSNQAPPGYVQDAVLEALSVVQRAGFSILHNIKD